MKYIALTGAAGLLGSYLLKDLLGSGCRLAVFVRKSRTENARSRIESILRRFENTLRVPLPRPVVLESDLCSEGLGLDSNARRWIADNVDTVIHNAASLEFLHDPKTNEPFRSNIHGTEHLLELVKECSIRKFHQVSTAYVCGLREGLIREGELNCGQTFGNAYEESKMKSETAVRAASFLDSVTVYRPAIIVGDSATGYTPTYHGFYTPLKILYPLLNRGDVTPEGIRAILNAMGLNGRDQKNFVPVDWISKVMTYIVMRPGLHGKCYHLAPGKRTSIDTLCDILVESLGIPKEKQQISLNAGSEKNLIETFLSQMNVYRAYWRNDPEFDMSNTYSAAGHIACPEMNEERMRLLMRYAVKSNFGWPHPKPLIPDHDSGLLLSRLDKKHDSPLKRDVKQLFGLRIVGSGGGDWTITSNENRDHEMESTPGLPCFPTPTARLNATLFRSLHERTKFIHDLRPGDITWENANDEWIACQGNVWLSKLLSQL